MTMVIEGSHCREEIPVKLPTVYRLVQKTGLCNLDCNFTRADRCSIFLHHENQRCMICNKVRILLHLEHVATLSREAFSTFLTDGGPLHYPIYCS